MKTMRRILALLAFAASMGAQADTRLMSFNAVITEVKQVNDYSTPPPPFFMVPGMPYNGTWLVDDNQHVLSSTANIYTTTVNTTGGEWSVAGEYLILESGPWYTVSMPPSTASWDHPGWIPLNTVAYFRSGGIADTPPGMFPSLAALSSAAPADRIVALLFMADAWEGAMYSARAQITSVTLLPIPEPAHYLMLMAGLALLMLRAGPAAYRRPDLRSGGSR